MMILFGYFFENFLTLGDHVEILNHNYAKTA
jgi:hypothetical protein